VITMKKYTLIFLFFLILAIFSTLIIPIKADAKDDLINNFKNLCPNYEVIGYTVNNHPIYAFHFGEGKTKVLIDAVIHGDEEMNSYLLYNFVNWVLNNNSDDAISIRKRLNITVIPIINFDHFNITRKNAHGVDLNRNFEHGWGNAGSDNSSSWQYRGTAPLSEPEAQALHNYFITLKPKVYINLHYFADCIYYLSFANKEAHNNLYNEYCSISNEKGISKWNDIETSDGGFAISDGNYYGEAEISEILETGEDEPTFNDVNVNGLVFNRFLCYMLAVSDIYGQENENLLIKNFTEIMVNVILMGVAIGIFKTFVKDEKNVV